MPAIQFTKPISKDKYLNSYAHDTEIMDFYETLLKKVNSSLSLQTGLKELPEIFSIQKKWDAILAERLSNAPSKKIAIDLFKKELQTIVNYDENAVGSPNESRYWNKYSKVAFDHILKGQNVQLQGLGYLVLCLVCENDKEGDYRINHVSSIYDVKGILISLAEGAALAYYLHIEYTNTGDDMGMAGQDRGDVILEHLQCLSGYWRNCKIMKDEEFKRLIEYARQTKENELPKNIQPISKGTSGLSKLFYQHTIYRLWKEMSKERGQKQALWIDFVKRVFKDQYQKTEHDVSKSFSRYTSGKSGYDRDKELITYKDH